MTIYGETNDQFRPKPGSLALLSVSLFSSLTGALVGASIASVARVFATRALRPEFPLVIYLPFASDPFAGLYTLRSYHAVLGAAPALAAPLLLALAILFVFPSSQTLASRLTVHTIVCTVIAYGSLAPLLDLRLIQHFRVLTGVERIPSLALFGAIALVLVLLIALVERRVYLVLGNVCLVDTPARRLLLWIVRIPTPFLGLALLCELNGWRGGAIASLAIVAVTFLESILHAPAYRFEQLTDVKMRGAALTWPLVAAALVAASLWIFGSAAARMPGRVVTIDDGKPSTAPLDRTQDTNREKFEPKIEMRWSKPKK